MDNIDKKTKEYLISLPNVVGFGHGMKYVKGIQTQEEALMVFVEKKVSETQLTPEELIPKTINNIKTDVFEIGKLVPHNIMKNYAPYSHSDKKMGNIYENVFAYSGISRTSRIRPAPPGVSIGHYEITAGTFGAVVYDDNTGQPLILSNNHVLANATNGIDDRSSLGDPILQPGPYDGGLNPFNTIASLYRFVPLSDNGVNFIDAAVAQPLRRSLIVPRILEIGNVKGTTTPSLGMMVKKSGRTTGLSYGQIIATAASVLVSYSESRVLLFENQILTTNMSLPGDSGSLLLNMRNKAIGLLFAGSSSITVHNPIGLVLDLLNVGF